jgi:phosphoribosylformimino-5-aminoimidazole carboxamide ribotide isomerase
MSEEFEIIPAIDLIDGKCVRLTEGDYAQKKVYNDDPLEVARSFEAAGIKRLHLVDLDGAKAGRVINWSVLEAITKHTRLSVDFGGGIKTGEEVARVLGSGARWATVGSIAVRDEATLLSWFEQYGPGRFFLGADVRNEKIAVGGWLETTSLDLVPFLQKYRAYGIEYLVCTDVSKDGRLEGPALELYERVLHALPGLQLVASGGVSAMDDIRALEAIGCRGVILGKAIYEGRITLEELV